MLGVLLVVTAVVLWNLRSGGLGFGGNAAAVVTESAPLGEPPIVRMDLLALTSEEYDPSGRNLFSYYTPPRKQVKKPVVKKPPPKPTSRPTPPPRKNRIPVTKPTDRLPTPTFSYIGYIGPKDRKIAVFDDSGEILLAAEGEVVQEEFRVAEFKYETVVMSFTDKKFQGKTTELTKGGK